MMLRSLRNALLATSAVAGLFGVGVPAAFAAPALCSSGTVTTTVDSLTNPANVTTSSCSVGSLGTVTGDVTNQGVLNPNGIRIINGSSIGGVVVNTGQISGSTGININNATVSSGISNSGTISVGFLNGIIVQNVPHFAGGINNSGTIIQTNATGAIVVQRVTTFDGSIINSGTITSPAAGINLRGPNLPTDIATFTGGISNSGVITAGVEGIRLGSASSGGVSIADGITNTGRIVGATGIVVTNGSVIPGGITNTGNITGTGSGPPGILVPTAIDLTGVRAGGIGEGAETTIDQMAGTISGQILLSSLGDIVNITGGTVAGNIVGPGDSGTINFAPGVGNTFTYGPAFAFSGVNQVNIDTGTVVLNGVQSAGALAVNNLGTLSGTGTVNALVSINSGGTLAPGTPGTPGTITLGPLTLNAGSMLSYQLGTPNVVGGPTNDLTNVNGTLTVNGDTLFVTNSANFGPGTYRLINYTTGTSPEGTGAIVVGTLPNGDTGVIQTSIAGEVNLIVTAAPATTKFWDGTTMVGDGTVHGGNGTWNNTFTNWTTETGTPNSAWNGIDAVFTAAAGTVTVAAPIVYQSIQFSTSGYVLTAAAGGTLRPTGVAPIIVDGGLTATIGTPIVGSGGVDKTGLGTLIITGTNTYTGGTTITAGTLQIGDGGTTGSIVGNILNNDILAFDRSDVFTFPGVISGTGGLEQIGSGTLVLSAVNSYTGPTDVVAGILDVTGSIASSSLTTVLSGAALTGTGTVGNTQINSGATFAPGNGTPGTSMTVSGNLAFQSGAFYVVQVNAATASFTTVSGTASLSGTVDAVFAPGTGFMKQYLILQSAGLGGTTFSDLATFGLPPGFIASLSYSPGDAFLNLTAALGAGTALTVNERNVATTLNNFFNTGHALPANFAGLFGLSGAPLANALTQLDGEVATGAERSAFILMSEFLGLMLNPFVYCGNADYTYTLTYCRQQLQSIGFAPEQQAEFPPDIALAYNAVFKAPPAAPATFVGRWTTWAAAFGGKGNANGDPVVGSNNVTTSTFGYAAGMDYHYSPDTVVGFALAGGATNWGLANALGTGSSNAFLAGVYGVSHAGPAYIAAALAFANNWFTTNRGALGDQLTANFQGQSVGARVEGGYRFAVPVYTALVGLTPYAALQPQYFHTPSYSEADLSGGGFGLSYNAMNGTDTRSELGGRFDELTTLSGIPLLLRAKLAWAHDWVSNPALNASFESLPGTSFTVFGAPIPHDSALASAGAQLFFSAHWSFIATFDAELAPASQFYAGSGTLRYTW